MPERSTRFLIDTNVFIASIKRGKTKSTELFLRLLDGPFDLIADDILVTEYERYAGKFGADEFLRFVFRRIVIIEQSEEDILACKPFFPPTEGADVIHAAACMHANATIITNDAHFQPIGEKGLIEVWSISEAISRLLE